MNTALEPSARRGLTRIEVVVLLAVTCFIGLVAMLQFSHPPPPPRSIRSHCLNNLKQVGFAFRMFYNDYEDKFPWAVSNAQGGSLEFTNSQYVFRHFLAASNELNTPKILACPVDRARSRANDFGKFSNGNLSYFVGLSAQESSPEMLLSGDRNITGGTLSNGFLRMLTSNSLSGWTSEIHTNAGNVGLADGSAEQLTPAGLQRHLQSTNMPAASLLAIP